MVAKSLNSSTRPLLAVVMVLGLTSTTTTNAAESGFDRFLKDFNVASRSMVDSLSEASKPLQGAFSSINKGASQLVDQIQQDPRVKETIKTIKEDKEVNEGMDSLKRLADDVGSGVDKMWIGFRREVVNPLADQAKPLLDSAQNRGQETWREIEKFMSS